MKKENLVESMQKFKEMKIENISTVKGGLSIIGYRFYSGTSFAGMTRYYYDDGSNEVCHDDDPNYDE